MNEPITQNSQSNQIKSSATPKDFFLHLASVVGLYMSAVSLVNLLFQVVDISFPDRLDYYVDPYSAQMRWAIAMLIIVFPIFVYISWVLNKDVKKFPEKANYWVKKWLSYMTLFVAGLAIVIDLIVLINNFLGGEITTRFFLKVASVLVVAVAVFGYYILELRASVNKPSNFKKIFAYVASIAVLISLVGGFAILGSPSKARQMRFDDQRINDLTNIQWQVVDYWQRTGVLPETLESLSDNISGFVAPKDPDSDTAYIYEKTGKLGFKLCATFGLSSDENERSGGSNMVKPISDEYQNWKHLAGDYCFDRTIDPTKYPPRSDKTVPGTVVSPKGI